MADSNELLREEVDEQHQRLMRDLRLIYHPDSQKAQHLDRIHQQLLTGDVPARLLAFRGGSATQHRSRGRKPHRSTPVEGRPWQRRFSMIAAVLVAALLVSSLLLVLNRSHRSSPGSTPSKPAGGPTTLLSLHMIDLSTGWALTEQTVLYTTDGGFQWKNVTPVGITLSRSSIADFPTASIASIATPRSDGASTQVLHTADSGQTWQQATIPMPFPRHLSFIDAQHGWLLAAVQPPQGAAESVSVFATKDGGKTWANVATALFADATPPGRLPYGGQKSGMSFLNGLTGWVTGTVSLPSLAWLYVTRDGGSTWQQQTLPMPPGVPSARLSILSPIFFSATDGILPVFFSDVVTESTLATHVYTTHDGGRTWQRTTSIFSALPLLSFADMQHGWATDGRVLYGTSDGGTHWLKLSPGASFKSITQLDFVTERVGWAISSTASPSSTLLKTVDGGRTWTSISATSA